MRALYIFVWAESLLLPALTQGWHSQSEPFAAELPSDTAAARLDVASGPQGNAKPTFGEKMQQLHEDFKTILRDKKIRRIMSHRVQGDGPRAQTSKSHDWHSQGDTSAVQGSSDFEATRLDVSSGDDLDATVTSSEKTQRRGDDVEAFRAPAGESHDWQSPDGKFSAQDLAAPRSSAYTRDTNPPIDEGLRRWHDEFHKSSEGGHEAVESVKSATGEPKRESIPEWSDLASTMNRLQKETHSANINMDAYIIAKPALFDKNKRLLEVFGFRPHRVDPVAVNESCIGNHASDKAVQGCFLAHQSVWSQIKASGQIALVLESDATPGDGTPLDWLGSRLAKAAANVRQSGLPTYFSVGHCAEMCTTAYFMNAEAADLGMKAQFCKRREAVDAFIHDGLCKSGVLCAWDSGFPPPLSRTCSGCYGQGVFFQNRTLHGIHHLNNREIADSETRETLLSESKRLHRGRLNR